MKPLTMVAFWLLVSMASGQNAKYQSPETGPIEIKHGALRWRADLMEQARPGTWWRLGSGSATTCELAGALVRKDGVVFPGQYNLNLKIGEGEWALLFHRGGTTYRDGPKFGNFPLTKSEVSGKTPPSDKLELNLEAPKDKADKAAGHLTFRIRFGPHILEQPWRVLGVTKKKAKFGKVGLTLETVKLPSGPEFDPILAGKAEEAFPVARLVYDQEQPDTILAIVPGEEPVLRFLGLDREVKGTRKAADPKVSVMKANLDGSHVEFQLGGHSVSFPLEADMFRKAELGGTTPKRGG